MWGDNLAMVDEPDRHAVDAGRWTDGILFVEDVNEQPYRIERMLLQLQQAGILDRQRLVLCGDFSNYRVADDDNGYDLAAGARLACGKTTAVPIVDRPAVRTHATVKVTLAVGAIGPRSRSTARSVPPACRT